MILTRQGEMREKYKEKIEIVMTVTEKKRKEGEIEIRKSIIQVFP